MASSTTTKPGDRLRKHADDLKSGRLTWVQDYPQRGEGCIMIGKPRTQAPRFLASIDEVQALADVVFTDCVTWNQTFGRTLTEVISALEAAADLLDKGAG